MVETAESEGYEDSEKYAANDHITTALFTQLIKFQWFDAQHLFLKTNSNISLQDRRFYTFRWIDDDDENLLLFIYLFVRSIIPVTFLDEYVLRIVSL